MKNINKYLKSSFVLAAFVYSVGTTIPMQSTYADEINTELVNNEIIKEWKPEGKVIETGEDGVPWELYENGYLLFKPEPGKDTLSNDYGKTSWKENYGKQIKAIGFTNKVYAPENSSYLFSIYNGSTFLSFDLKYIDASKIDTSKVENANSMFYYSNIKELDVSNWDTSKISDMGDMFNHAELTNINVGNWNTSKVQSMRGMFSHLKNLKFLDVSNWDIANVTDLSYMFDGANIEELDLGKWNTNNVISIDWIFNKNKKLKKIKMSETFKNAHNNHLLFSNLNIHDYGDLYTDKWMKEDGSAGPYDKYELQGALFTNPEILSGTWVREYKGYHIIFETGTDENIEPLEMTVGKIFELQVPKKVKEGYHFVGWSKTQDSEIIKDKTNLGKRNETITLYAKWVKNPPVSTNTPTDENNNSILPPTFNELPEFNEGVNPADAPIYETHEYTDTLSTNTPVDDNGNLILPPVLDKPEFNRGVNPIEPPVTEKPEYKGPLSTNTPIDENENPILPPIVENPEFNGSVNSTEPPVENKPEYTGSVSTNTPVDDNGNLIAPPTVEQPEYKTDSTVQSENETTKEETKLEKERELPNTNSTSILTTLVSSVIGTLSLGYKSKRRK